MQIKTVITTCLLLSRLVCAQSGYYGENSDICPCMTDDGCSSENYMPIGITLMILIAIVSVAAVCRIPHSLRGVCNKYQNAAKLLGNELAEVKWFEGVRWIALAATIVDGIFGFIALAVQFGKGVAVDIVYPGLGRYFATTMGTIAVFVCTYSFMLYWKCNMSFGPVWWLGGYQKLNASQQEAERRRAEQSAALTGKEHEAEAGQLRWAAVQSFIFFIAFLTFTAVYFKVLVPPLQGPCQMYWPIKVALLYMVEALALLGYVVTAILQVYLRPIRLLVVDGKPKRSYNVPLGGCRTFLTILREAVLIPLEVYTMLQLESSDDLKAVFYLTWASAVVTTGLSVWNNVRALAYYEPELLQLDI